MKLQGNGKLKKDYFFLHKQETTKSAYFFCDLYVVILLVLVDACFDSVLSRLVGGTLVDEDCRTLVLADAGFFFAFGFFGLSTGSEPSGNLREANVHCINQKNCKCYQEQMPLWTHVQYYNQFCLLLLVCENWKYWLENRECNNLKCLQTRHSLFPKVAFSTWNTPSSLLLESLPKSLWTVTWAALLRDQSFPAICLVAKSPQT